MAWRHLILVAALVLVGALAAAGSAAADHAAPDGWTSTGDVDTYGVWTSTHVGALACPQVAYEANVTLTLLHPAPGDRVLLSGQKTTADAAVATWDDPVANVQYASGGCGGYLEVVGLTVSGDLGYTLDGTR